MWSSITDMGWECCMSEQCQHQLFWQRLVRLVSKVVSEKMVSCTPDYMEQPLKNRENNK